MVESRWVNENRNEIFIFYFVRLESRLVDDGFTEMADDNVIEITA